MRKLEAELNRYAASDAYPFHMPGHKRRGDESHRLDITEIDGFDNLHEPEGIILEEMQNAAAFYRTRTTYFSVNGSTCAILAAISAAVKKGGTLLTERGAHISVYHAAYLRELNLKFIDYPDQEETKDLTPDAVLITSPSYEGCVKDIRYWAEYAGKRGIPLIVDEAHGAHFSLHPSFPESAVRLGADLVIQSLHKTLPAMTQTALLHQVTDKVDARLIKRFLDVYETSSPSYVLLSSITSCIHLLMNPYNDLMERYAASLRGLRERLSMLSHLHLAGGTDCMLKSNMELPPYKKGTKMDPGKLVMTTGESSLDGAGLYDLVRTKYRLQPEMKAPGYVLFMTSPFDTAEGFERLLEALTELDREAGKI
jgi:arginine/lysine/ornithine decarboxylase